jgi:hypothetical protein
MRRFLALPVVLLLAAPAARAEEPHGCDKFAWDVTAAQKLLAGPAMPAGSGPADRAAGIALSLSLVPFAEAKLERPPERAPKQAASFAGLVRFQPASEAGVYAVSLDAGAWIDVIQDGAYLKPVAFTGALDCPHIRKSVRFRLGPGPFTLQISDVDTPTIDLAVTPAD